MFLLFIGPIIGVAVAIIAAVVIVSSVGGIITEIDDDE